MVLLAGGRHRPPTSTNAWRRCWIGGRRARRPRSPHRHRRRRRYTSIRTGRCCCVLRSFPATGPKAWPRSRWRTRRTRRAPPGGDLQRERRPRTHRRAPPRPLLLPEETHDASFAMTSSFGCMLYATLAALAARTALDARIGPVAHATAAVIRGQRAMLNPSPVHATIAWCSSAAACCRAWRARRR